MIVYEFEILNFSAADGDTRILVLDGRLELETAPTRRMLALIEKSGGKLVEETKQTKKLTAKSESK